VQRSGRRAPVARRGVTGGGATGANVKRTVACDHTGLTGYPPDKTVMAAAHPRGLPMRRVEDGAARCVSSGRGSHGGGGSRRWGPAQGVGNE
jgi:hypothetical protein